jgi:phosphoribosylcarboxyaminoimidazole (NCAIR) mutase
MAVGKSGAANAGLLAAEILALTDARLARKLVEFRRKLAAEVAAKSRRLRV